MKLRLLILFSLALLSYNCKDNCDAEVNLTVDSEQLEIDKANIQEYLSSNNIDAETHPSGISYVITREGEGRSPNLCDNVAVTYEGRLMSNGNVFDSSPSVVSFNLQQLITGWQIGIPLLKEGGLITLYIPSVYAYGEDGSRTIPGNSNLIFVIRLFGVN